MIAVGDHSAPEVRPALEPRQRTARPQRVQQSLSASKDEQDLDFPVARTVEEFHGVPSIHGESRSNRHHHRAQAVGEHASRIART